MLHSLTLYRKWRKRRDQAGILIGYIYIIHRIAPDLEEEAWSIYENWKNEEINFEEALRKLEELIDSIKARAR